jgi:hypothetical protein
LGFCLWTRTTTIGLKIFIHPHVDFFFFFLPSDTPDRARRDLLQNAMQLVRSSKGRSIFLSSGSSDPMALRAPRCAANLAVLMGVESGRALAVVGEGPRQLAERGFAMRTTHRGAAVVDLGEGVEAVGYVRAPRAGDGTVRKAAKADDINDQEDDDQDDDKDDDEDEDDDEAASADFNDGAKAPAKKRKAKAAAGSRKKQPRKSAPAEEFIRL